MRFLNKLQLHRFGASNFHFIYFFGGAWLNVTRGITPVLLSCKNIVWIFPLRGIYRNENFRWIIGFCEFHFRSFIHKIGNELMKQTHCLTQRIQLFRISNKPSLEPTTQTRFQTTSSNHQTRTFNHTQNSESSSAKRSHHIAVNNGKNVCAWREIECILRETQGNGPKSAQSTHRGPEACDVWPATVFLCRYKTRCFGVRETRKVVRQTRNAKKGSGLWLCAFSGC